MASADDAVDPYVALGVDRNASLDDLRAAFRRAARAAHPDAGGDPVTFVRVRLAFELLSDPDRRARFDRSRLQATVSSAAASTRNPSGPADRAGAGGGVPRGPDVASVRRKWLGAGIRWRRTDVAAGGDLPVIGDRPGTGPGWGPGGGIVVATGEERHGVVALDLRRGVTRWDAALGAAIVSGPSVVGGTVVVVTVDGVVHGLDASSGTTRWTTRPGPSMTATGTVAGEGVRQRWVGAGDGGVVAIDGAGRVCWQARPAGGIARLDAVGSVVVASGGDDGDELVMALDVATGRNRWWLRRRGARAFAAAAPDTMWLVAGRHLVLVDVATGEALHEVEVPAPVTGCRSTATATLVAVGDGSLVALSAGGSPRWRVHLPTTAALPVAIDGVWAAWLADASLRLLSQHTGAELHALDLGSQVPSPWTPDAVVRAVVGDGVTHPPGVGGASGGGLVLGSDAGVAVLAGVRPAEAAPPR